MIKNTFKIANAKSVTIHNQQPRTFRIEILNLRHEKNEGNKLFPTIFVTKTVIKRIILSLSATNTEKPLCIKPAEFMGEKKYSCCFLTYR